ncbi:MAG: PAS domain-containing protein [Agarilytica sp.]
MLDKLFGNKSPSPVASKPKEFEGRKELLSALNRYDRIFRGSRGYGFMDWDIETGRLHWHGGFLAYLGYDEEEALSVDNVERFNKFVHPDDVASLREQQIALLKDPDHPGVINTRALKRDGGSVDVEMRLEADRREDGWVNHLSGLVFDVSALKDTEAALLISEARLKRIIAAANDGIWEWSAELGGKRMKLTDDGQLDWSNQEDSFTFGARCWEMIGYSEHSAEAKAGLRTWRRLMHPDDGERFDKTILAHVFKQKPLDVEYRIKAKSGEWRWLRGRGQMSYDAEGRPNILSGTNMDITELKHAEERVLRAKEEAEKASQAKSEFLSSMSHELRTPLNAILGFAQLFELDKNLSLEQRDNIQEIKSAGNHLLELVGDVLNLAKIESGHLQLNLERVICARVITECAVLLKPQYETRDLLLAVEFNGLETHSVLADPVRLKQVILNLMANAGKYNKSAGQVYIECKRVENDCIRISVKDTGLGIAPELQNQLFQPFNRLGAERSGVEGTGVGLVITKQLVEQMGGRIGFSSELGEGSEFWVEFASVSKAEKNEEEISYSEKIAATEEIPELALQGRKKILYVEDNVSNQKLMDRLMGRYPEIDLHMVGLGVQGLYLARSLRPDLIILDVNLPGINGFELLQILKQDTNTKDIPIIALSANVLAYDIEKGKDSGFDRYLTKPLDLAQLINVFNELMGAG